MLKNIYFTGKSLGGSLLFFNVFAYSTHIKNWTVSLQMLTVAQVALLQWCCVNRWNCWGISSYINCWFRIIFPNQFAVWLRHLRMRTWHDPACRRPRGGGWSDSCPAECRRKFAPSAWCIRTCGATKTANHRAFRHTSANPRGRARRHNCQGNSNLTREKQW